MIIDVMYMRSMLGILMGFVRPDNGKFPLPVEIKATLYSMLSFQG
jgi:hypothetical protein